jgi:hypothetical protein
LYKKRSLAEIVISYLNKIHLKVLFILLFEGKSSEERFSINC